jgi:hypothetical protein
MANRHWCWLPRDSVTSPAQNGVQSGICIWIDWKNVQERQRKRRRFRGRPRNLR